MITFFKNINILGTVILPVSRHTCTLRIRSHSSHYLRIHFLSCVFVCLILQSAWHFSVEGAHRTGRCYTHRCLQIFSLDPAFTVPRRTPSGFITVPLLHFSIVLIIKKLITNIRDFLIMMHTANMSMHGHSF